MALVFQYGSNMSVTRMNAEDRLAGDAKSLYVARTAMPFQLEFTVWSNGNKCAAADLVASEGGRSIYGVVYEVPDFLLSRETSKLKNRKSLDSIEGAGKNYFRTTVELIAADNVTISAFTYFVKDPKKGLKTASHYVAHILKGLDEHDFPAEYRLYVQQQILQNGVM